MHRSSMFAAWMVSACVATAGTAIPDYLPPTTNALIGFQVRALLDSGLLKELGADALKNATAKVTSSSPLPGVNPLTDLDDILVATTAEGDHPPTLAICRGRFPADQLGAGEHYRGVPIHHAKDGSVAALLDAGTILAGPLKEVHDAIDRRAAHAGGIKPGLAQRAVEMSGKYAIWGVGNLPKGFTPPAGNVKMDGFSSMDRFDFGIGLISGLQIAASIHVRAPEDAQKLAAGLQMLQMMAQMRPEANGAKIETHAENGTLSLSIALSEEALKKAIVQQRGAIGQAFANGLARGAGRTGAGTITVSPGTTPSITTTPAQGPVSTETQVVTDGQGNTIEVTLPGARKRF
jgi:hypothetical protein